MSVRIPTLLAALILPATAAMGGDLHKDAAIGGAIGGALGGVVGAEVGGREGAIVGSGIGAAVGTGVSTRDHDDHGDYRYRERHRHEIQHNSHPSRFCPPGQAKKGRC
ncbi:MULTISPECIES: glycine zipper domain-containing protein [unclassified Guyparkeria]|uniref:glycine zipper domain-containing protein n=1 Tax=unclassified Guyparkeria TaxID=2626246 RepID=UPI00073367FB|nr:MULTISPECIES: glycine zipper domain-containing protein [unclassified Guyparkeria]KTG16210.1 hypothetical protein AUR63_05075 [Guyparkeria sp. XI15]OAE85061.1 hypothetical protein AWR35_05085 [Guyparkeria sp. WRN-7]